MTKAKELLDAATPLPWYRHLNKVARGLEGIAECQSDERDDREELANADLIVYAVNTLPAYEAAVEALEDIVMQEGRYDDILLAVVPKGALRRGREALRRLQEQTQ